MELAEKKLGYLVNVQSLDEVPAVMPESLVQNVPEITFTLEECVDFIPLNSVDLKLNQLQILMSLEKMKTNRSKAIPKIDLAGFYGKSGEAYVSEPLDLATSWSVMSRFSWTLFGNSLEVTNSQEKTNPNELIEPTALTDNNTIDAKLGIADDLSYFVDSKESKIGIRQAESEYTETLNKMTLSLQKSYNSYTDSLRNERTIKNEIDLKERKLALLVKRNELYEIPTVQLMEETWKYAETISSFSKAIYANYSAVAEMERMVLISLR
jgi:outer membrane protein TolC